MFKRTGLLFFLILMLVGCRKIDDPRSRAAKLITIEITETGCKPVEVIVPVGKIIQVQLDNQTSNDFTWYILFFDLEGEFDPSDLENQIAKLNAPAQTLTHTQFTAPKITAKYQTVCAPDNAPDHVNLINLLVVEPYESEK